VHLQPPRACSWCKQTPVSVGPKQFLSSSSGPPGIADRNSSPSAEYASNQLF
jgi:hypothetical protein